MFFAQNNTLDKFELYLSFLKDIIESGNEKYKAVYSSILTEAHQLTTGDIDYASVSSDNFDIVSILVYNHPDYFRTLDLAALSNERYQEILNFLQRDINQLVH